MEIGDIYSGGSYLKAADVVQPVVVTINKIEAIEFPSKDKEGKDIKRKKLVLSFDEIDKQFVANKTNSNIIAGLLGSTNTDNWSGQKIKLWKSKTDFGGRMVDCVSVSPA